MIKYSQLIQFALFILWYIILVMQQADYYSRYDLEMGKINVAPMGLD